MEPLAVTEKGVSQDRILLPNVECGIYGVLDLGLQKKEAKSIVCVGCGELNGAR
jgi:hypothetical protein